MRVVILGCGRVGALIAGSLSANHDVTVIDWNSGSFSRLSTEFAGQTFVGNGIDSDVLRAAGVAEASLFLALTDGDNRNLMASQVARTLGAEHVVARVYDPIRAEVFNGRGITTVSPTVRGAARLFELVTGEEKGA